LSGPKESKNTAVEVLKWERYLLYKKRKTGGGGFQNSVGLSLGGTDGHGRRGISKITSTLLLRAGEKMGKGGNAQRDSISA